MKTPRFSVIIPALNEEKFLPKLLASLAAQTTRDFEVIVVDGKSRDKTVAEAKSFEKKLPHLEVLVSPKASLPFQRNLGAREARGEWLAFVDADSVLLPHLLERVSHYIDAQQPRFLTTWFRSDSENAGDATIALFGNIITEASLLLKKQFAPGPLMMVTQEAYVAVGGYDETHTYNEDADFSIRAYKQGIPLHVVRETLFILSLRRLRKEGMIKLIQQYVLSSIPILFWGRPMKHMPGYIMGGHLYGKRKPRRSVVKQLEKTAKMQ